MVRRDTKWGDKGLGGGGNGGERRTAKAKNKSKKNDRGGKG